MDQVKYFLKHGSSKGIDEETDAYSDGEDEKDTPERRRQNREVIRVVNAEAAALRARAASKPEFKGTTMSRTLTLDTVTSKSDPRVGFEVEGMSRFTDKTLDAARSLDYNARTTAYQARSTTRGPNGLDQDAQRTLISFDLSAVIESYFGSKKYGWFAAGGAVALIVFVVITWNVVSQLYSYL